MDKGNQSAAKAQLHALGQIVEEYHQICGSYPSNEQGLNALLASPNPPANCKAFPKLGILQSQTLPKDPWGNGFLYSQDGSKFTITSFGKDGKEGGEGFDADIRKSN